MNFEIVTPEHFTNVNCDTSGNPRAVIHFPSLLTRAELDRSTDIEGLFSKAVKRANKIGGSKYRGKEYGGMIVFQSHNLPSTCKRINEVLAKITKEA